MSYKKDIVIFRFSEHVEISIEVDPSGNLAEAMYKARQTLLPFGIEWRDGVEVNWITHFEVDPRMGYLVNIQP